MSLPRVRIDSRGFLRPVLYQKGALLVPGRSRMHDAGVEFFEELREFLRHPIAFSPGDKQRYRRCFLAGLERCEREGRSAHWLEGAHRRLGDALDSFTGALEYRLVRSGLAPDEIPELVEAAIRCELELPHDVDSVTRRLALDAALFGLPVGPVQRWSLVPLYAQEIRALRMRQGRAPEVSEIGRVLLDLTGLAALEWLLHIEVALSTGVNDPWRIDRGTLQHVVRLSGRLYPFDGWEEMDPVMNEAGLDRLGAWGLLERISDEPGEDESPHHETLYGYRVHEHARTILDQVGSGSETPMAVLAAGLLEDDVQRRLPGSSAMSSSEAMVRQTRLVVHELGNSLRPVQMTLKRIYREATRAGIDKDIAPYRERVDRGIERMLEFARELQDAARLHEEVADVFDPVAALRDAIGIIETEGHEPRFDVSMSLPAVMGVRARFVLAVADILRNAYRAAPQDGPRVTIETSVERGRVHIAIEDNGPGIASEQRERIFMNGYSTRDDSSGHGLALARATIEDDMNGTLSYVEGSALGGARFVITLPAHDPGSAS